MLISTTLLVSVLAPLALCVAPGEYSYGFDVSNIVKRQASPDQDLFVVKGLSRLNGTTPLRPEIRQLQRDNEGWTLYILASSLMQYSDQSLQTSFFQVAGIHGVPFIPWGGVQPTPGNENSGYCSHMSVLFPAWHRPYLVLYEQLICGLEQWIASLYTGTDKQRFEAAAANCRIPYFDWAIKPTQPEGPLPYSIGGSPEIDVAGPNGIQRIANPLFSYEFKPPNGSIFITAPWDTWNRTLRAPTTSTPLATSNNTEVAAQLAANLPSIQQRLYNLFSNYGNYTEFSNEAWIPQGKESQYDSIESLHDTLHTILGGSMGQMAYIPFSSFDPIFFLHHAMVDRVFAMWQVLYPSAWVVPQPAKMNSYTTSKGQIQDSKTPLTPFYASSNGTFWTADTVRDPETFGYTYAEIAGASISSGASNSTARLQLIQVINKLYGGSSPSTLKIPTGKAQSLDERSLRRSPTSAAVSSIVDSNNKLREWTANIRVEKQALGGPFFIHLFLGPVSEDHRAWSAAYNLAGTMSVFASPQLFSAKLQMQTDDMVTAGTVPLTSSLAEKVASGSLPNLNIDTVERYLQESLQVRVVRSNGRPVDHGTVSGLHIQIASARVHVPSTSLQLPVWDAVDFAFDLV